MSFFSNFLPDKTQLAGTWEVALVEVSFPGICSNNEGGLMTIHYDNKEKQYLALYRSLTDIVKIERRLKVFKP